jgi:3-hydroxymyristoyl/3-hydroxydecanoyl-(acyl carrier protein) dehydratase
MLILKRLKMGQFDKYKNDKGEIETVNVMKIIPYNEHFLFIDRVVSLTDNKIVAVKKITGDEDFLKGHFVGFPIMPGALTIEGMGQAATFLARSNIPNHEEKHVLAYKLKDVQFLSPIFPKNEVRFELDLIAQDPRGAILKGKAYVKEDLAAEAFITIAIIDKNDFKAKFGQ